MQVKDSPAGMVNLPVSMVMVLEVTETDGPPDPAFPPQPLAAAAVSAIPIPIVFLIGLPRRLTSKALPNPGNERMCKGGAGTPQFDFRSRINGSAGGRYAVEPALSRPGRG